jgi:hypothetical protein
MHINKWERKYFDEVIRREEAERRFKALENHVREIERENGALRALVSAQSDVIKLLTAGAKIKKEKSPGTSLSQNDGDTEPFFEDEK